MSSEIKDWAQAPGGGDGLAAIADQLVVDWDARGRMPQMAWDFRGFAADGMRRAIAALSAQPRSMPAVSIDYTEDYPEHSRASCSDENPCNSDVEGSGCHRCNGLFFNRAQEMEAILAAQPRPEYLTTAYTRGYEDAIALNGLPMDSVGDSVSVQPASAPVGVGRLINAAEGAEALIGVMFGRADGSMPDSIRAPLGIPVKVGAIAKELREALAQQPAAVDGADFTKAEVIEVFKAVKHGRLSRAVLDECVEQMKNVLLAAAQPQGEE